VPAATYQPAADMQNAVASINKYLRDTAKSVQFNIDASTGKTVVNVVDSNTHEVIRQMPSEETLAIARAISRLSGLLLDEKA
jgi:flagellar protein FlaG